MGDKARTVEQLLADKATKSKGLVTRRDLLVAGLTRNEIHKRVTKGLLIREHRGVYRMGHQAPDIGTTYLAAVLACGDEAWLCGRAAAHYYGLLRAVAAPEVMTRTERRVPGVRTYRCRLPDPRDVRRWRGMPITSVARTIVDVGAAVAIDQLARACHEAGVKFRLTPHEVSDALARRPNAPGARDLVRVIEGDVNVSLSKLESAFLALVARHGLPAPVTNRPAGAHRVDCRWPEQALTVELDSYRFHNSRYSWEQDRGRERDARARGDEFRRYTWADVFEDPTFIVPDLTALLASSPE